MSYTNLPHKPESSTYLQIEELVLSLFEGLVRKDGVTPMAFHSIRVGRDLVSLGYELPVVFAGYMHDVPEDIEHISSLTMAERSDVIYDMAINYMDADDALRATGITMQCIYLPHEYACSKLERKRLACERWGNSDISVMAVKMADIRDNYSDMASLSDEWKSAYNAWSIPLYERMTERTKALSGKHLEI